MPRFFFNVTDGAATLIDRSGQILNDTVHAADVAKQHSELLARLSRDWVVQIEDDNKNSVYYASLNNSEAHATPSDGKSGRNGGSLGSKQLQGFDAERRAAVFRQTEQIAHVGGWEIDLNTKQLFWSDQMFRIYDLPVGETPSFRESLGYFPTKGRRMLRAALAAAVRQNEVVQSRNGLRQRKR